MRSGGYPITGYTVTAIPVPGGAPVTCATPPVPVDGAEVPTTGCVVEGLADNTEYEFTATATNTLGSGETSDPVVASPLSPPGPPTDVVASPGNAAVEVSWSAPGDDGGSVVSGYTVTASPGDGVGSCSTSGATACVVEDLVNGTTYTFTVVATNDAGSSGPSQPSEPVEPQPVPGQPTGVETVPGDRAVTVSWEAPVDPGDGPVDEYLVTAAPGNESCDVQVETPGVPLQCVVENLQNGTEYTFTVVATNQVGTGLPSTEVTAVPRTVPGPPTEVAATPGNGIVTVSWSAPEDDGGSAVTGYTVTASSPGGGVGSCSTTGATSCVVSGLANGTEYTFTVVATNDAGSSVSSQPSGPVTPLGAPNRPGLPRVTPQQGSLRVAVVPPTGGFTPTSYVATSVPGSRSCTVTGSSGVCTITGLNPSTAYRVTVVARTLGGASPPSAAPQAVTPGMGSPNPQFIDVPAGTYYVRPTSMLRDRGITTGYAGTNRFEPSLLVTRAEMAAFLWRMAGEPAGNASCGWADQGSIPSWARTATCWLRATGITTGYAGTNRFEPSLLVTRAEMAAFLWRFAGRPAATSPCGFTDQARIPSWARTPACWLRAARITTNNPYRPSDLVTRAEMSAFLYRTGGVQRLWLT